MIYVYIIRSINHPDQIYVGCTEDIDKRLSNHNCGASPHTSKYKPWKLHVYTAFSDKLKAYEFEEYLKSGSGRAFRDKRLLNLPKDNNNPNFCISDFEKFIKFVEKRFGVYLDSTLGFKSNLEKINFSQGQIGKILQLSPEELDQRSFFYGEGKPPTDTETARQKTLLQITQQQFKTNNSATGINNVFAIHNCLSDIYNQWKITKKNMRINDDKDIGVMDYIAQLRNRTQHELYDEKNLIKANTLIMMPHSLSNYAFPRFEEGGSITLNENDCVALIKEIKLSLETYFL